LGLEIGKINAVDINVERLQHRCINAQIDQGVGITGLWKSLNCKVWKGLNQ
jgi:hypothetical protein